MLRFAELLPTSAIGRCQRLVSIRCRDSVVSHQNCPHRHQGDGDLFAIRSAQQNADFVIAAIGAGFTPDHLSEHAVDEMLAQRFPRGERYVGWPMLFLMRLQPRAQ